MSNMHWISLKVNYLFAVLSNHQPLLGSELLPSHRVYGVRAGRLLLVTLYLNT